MQIELAAKETARWQREADETHNDKLVAVVREGSRIEREASQRASDALVSAIQQASATISDVKGEIVALNAKVSKITSPLAPRTNAVANISDAITPIGLGGVRFLFVSTCVSGRWGGARGRLARAGREGGGGAGRGMGDPMRIMLGLMITMMIQCVLRFWELGYFLLAFTAHPPVCCVL